MKLMYITQPKSSSSSSSSTAPAHKPPITLTRRKEKE